MIIRDKNTDIFCTLDKFNKKFDTEVAKGKLIFFADIRQFLATLPLYQSVHAEKLHYTDVLYFTNRFITHF